MLRVMGPEKCARLWERLSAARAAMALTGMTMAAVAEPGGEDSEEWWAEVVGHMATPTALALLEGLQPTQV